MRLKRVRGIFFDLDDTLIQYTEAEHRALAAGCRRAAEIRPNLCPRELAAAIYEVYAQRFAYGAPGFAELATLPMRAFRSRITGEALQRLGIVDSGLIETLVAVYQDVEREALCLYPGAIETLRYLRPHFRLGIITNGPARMQREKIAALALDDWFDVVVVDTEFGHPKPDRRIFDHASRAVDLEPHEMLFVGNSFEADVLGARGAGWTAVWMNAGEAALPTDAAPPEHRIAELWELTRLAPVRHALEPEPVSACIIGKVF